MFVSNTIPVRTYGYAPITYIPSVFNTSPTMPVEPTMPQAPVADSQQIMLQIADQLALLLAQLMNPAEQTPAEKEPKQTDEVKKPKGHQHDDNKDDKDTKEVSNSDGLQGRSQGHLGQWGDKDEAMLDKAVQGVANGHGSDREESHFDAIFSQFGQNNIGNCVSTGVIKAAMDHFEGKLFDQVSKDADGYKVRLRNGSAVHISRAELRQAGHACQYDGKPSEVKSMAVLSYAVIAKRESRSRGISLAAAFKDMGNGYNTSTAVKYLGLEGNVKRISASKIDKYDGVFAHGGHHVVYVDQNHTDHYGRAQKFNNTNTIGDKLDGLWAFTG